MILNGIKGQKGNTLLEFYAPDKWPSSWGKMPEMMCQLVKYLESLNHDPVFVFTSHAELLFTKKDDYQNWSVLVKVVEVNDKQSYKITASQESPWHHLVGFADNHIKAAELVISGISVSNNGRLRNIFLDST